MRTRQRAGYRGGRPVSRAAATWISGVDFHIRRSDRAGDALLLWSPSGLRANAVVAFWLAYILTRPLGASIGDFLAQARPDGGLGLGPTETSYIFLAAILGLVGYLTVTRKDEIPDAVQAQAVPLFDQQSGREPADSGS
jgi:hypothetical protein